MPIGEPLGTRASELDSGSASLTSEPEQDDPVHAAVRSPAPDPREAVSGALFGPAGNPGAGPRVTVSGVSGTELQGGLATSGALPRDGQPRSRGDDSQVGEYHRARSRGRLTLVGQCRAGAVHFYCRLSPLAVASPTIDLRQARK